MVDTIDTHTAGEPTRLVTSGLDRRRLRSGSVREIRDRFAEEHDEVRQLLMKEPRGHDSMFGAVPVPPESDAADAGLFFMDNDGYLDMCGHGTIGFLTAFLRTGRLQQKSEFKIETPAGVVTAEPSLTDDGTLYGIRIQNVVSFVEDRTAVTVEVGGESTEVPVSIVYAGNYFAMVDAEAVGYAVERRYVTDLVQLGLRIRAAVNEAVDLSNPSTGDDDRVGLVEFYESKADHVDRNVTIFGNGLVDRSPCGTGTCAKMALLHDDGTLSKDETYRHESIIGTQFEGRIRGTTVEDGRRVIVPEITGSAYVTGKHTFVKEPTDPLNGFKLDATD